MEDNFKIHERIHKNIVNVFERYKDWLSSDLHPYKKTGIRILDTEDDDVLAMEFHKTLRRICTLASYQKKHLEYYNDLALDFLMGRFNTKFSFDNDEFAKELMWYVHPLIQPYAPYKMTDLINRCFRIFKEQDDISPILTNDINDWIAANEEFWFRHGLDYIKFTYEVYKEYIELDIPGPFYSDMEPNPHTQSNETVVDLEIDSHVISNFDF